MAKRRMWADKRYHSADWEMKHRFGGKVYRVALDGGFSCPNRDGTLGYGGCTFCSAGGSGDFAASRSLSIHDQIDQGFAFLSGKPHDDRCIAYFQAFTGTYGPAERLRSLYEEALSHPRVVALAIATRPDCLGEDVLDLLAELSERKPVWVELGLQTIHEKTAARIRRGYPLRVFEKAVTDLTDRHLETIVHMILGLPEESPADMLATAEYLAGQPVSGIKLQLLHILKGTDLYRDYLQGRCQAMTLEAYTDILIDCIMALPQEMVIHRITGDGPRDLLAAPLWSLDKKRVLNHLHHEMKLRDAWQGKTYKGDT